MAIEPGDKRHAFGVVVPDLPGCFSAGDTLDQALDNVSEAIELWLETVIDDGGAVPEPHSITEHRANPEFAGWIWTAVDVDFATLSNKVERVNITLPAASCAASISPPGKPKNHARPILRGGCWRTASAKVDNDKV